MALVSARLEMNWSDYSGERAVKQMKQPVLLIGGGKDTISPPADLAVLSSNAPPSSKTIMVPVADHYMLPYFFQELDQPVKAWFREHLAMDRQSLHGDPEGERPPRAMTLSSSREDEMPVSGPAYLTLRWKRKQSAASPALLM